MRIRFTKEQKERLDITAVCAYCEHASPLRGDDMLCPKYGVVTVDHSCRKFRYDLLKRKPAPRTLAEPLLTEPLPTLDD